MRSENSTVLETLVPAALQLVAKSYGYSRIDVEGVRTDNGSAARKAARSIAPGKWLAGCFAHEVFKAAKRNASWKKPFANLEAYWESNALARASPISQHSPSFGKEFNAWMHLGYRCPTVSHFRFLGELLAQVAEEAKCTPAANQFRLKIWSSPPSVPRFRFWNARGPCDAKRD